MAGTSPAMAVMEAPGVPCPTRKFPANSLLGRKKFPVRPRREFCRRTLDSKAFSMPIAAERGRIPCGIPPPQGISLPAGSNSYILPSRRISRITALSVALSEAITMFGSIPTPCNTRSSESWIST